MHLFLYFFDIFVFVSGRVAANRRHADPFCQSENLKLQSKPFQPGGGAGSLVASHQCNEGDVEYSSGHKSKIMVNFENQRLCLKIGHRLTLC